MTHSLHRRLLLTLLSIITLFWLLAFYSSYRDTRHEVGELFDAQMAQTARTLLSVAGHELIELSGTRPNGAHIHFTGETKFTVDGHKYEHKLAYQLWKQPEGVLLLRSFSAPDAPLSKSGNGYSSREINGEHWRVFSLLDERSGFQVQVGEALELRNEITDVVTLRLGLPALVILPLLAFLISFGISKSLRPLQRIAATVANRAPSNLEALTEPNVPEEITPLVEALNRLFLRLEEAFESERRFTADAAHELRTPLAALKIQAQVAKRSSDETERALALDKVLEGVDRASRLVEQLLTLARVDPDSSQTLGETLRLDRLCEDVMADMAATAGAKNIDLELSAAAPIEVRGMRESLAILLRNVLDNAIRYTPEGGNVSVSLRQQEGNGVELRIADSGPGIPDSEREQIFNRFYRLAGQETGGSGLGLSIVKRIAELNQAEISLERSALGGLEVVVKFSKRRL